MNDQPEVKTFKEKLLSVQTSIGAITKDAVNEFANNHQYFDINTLIAELMVYLEATRLLVTQPIINGFVVTKIEDLDSDDFKESSLKLPELENPQKIGSCITYYRRYTLSALLGLYAEDDDANLASKPKTSKAKPGNDSDKDKEWLKEGTPQYVNALKAISEGKTIKDIREHYKVSKKVAELLET